MKSLLLASLLAAFCAAALAQDACVDCRNASQDAATRCLNEARNPVERAVCDARFVDAHRACYEGACKDAAARAGDACADCRDGAKEQAGRCMRVVATRPERTLCTQKAAELLQVCETKLCTSGK